MKRVLLLHNQDAGDEDYFRSELVQIIKNEGHDCTYFPIKENNNWKKEIDNIDLIVVAGGDGTIRRIVKELMKRKKRDQRIPLAILPMGTANNLSRSLQYNPDLDIKSRIRNWKDAKKNVFDLGEIHNAYRSDYFLEGTGYGIFPELIRQMDARDLSHLERAEDRLKLALQELHSIVLSAPAAPFQIEADGKLLEGKALLVEVMNIQSVGPNLNLAASAKIDDGVFDLVIVHEEQRNAFADHVAAQIGRQEDSWRYKSIQAKKLIIDCKSEYMHIDDELITNSQQPSIFIVHDKALKFLI